MAEVAQEQQYENPMEGQQEYGGEQATEEEAMEVRKNRGRRFLQNRRCVEMLLGYTDSNGILKISSDALFSLSAKSPHSLLSLSLEANSLPRFPREKAGCDFERVP